MRPAKSDRVCIEAMALRCTVRGSVLCDWAIAAKDKAVKAMHPPSKVPRFDVIIFIGLNRAASLSRVQDMA
jgi:hypothetical protein